MIKSVLLALLVVAVCAVAIWATEADEQNWQAYKASHHCVAAGTKHGQIGTGLSTRGKLVITSTPDQTIYQCDNGEIQIR